MEFPPNSPGRWVAGREVVNCSVKAVAISTLRMKDLEEKMMR